MAKTSKKKTVTKGSVKTSKKKAVAKSSAKKATKAVSGKRRGPKPGAKRIIYPLALRKQVAQAVRKGLKHLEAAKKFKVGVHSIPGWLRKY